MTDANETTDQSLQPAPKGLAENSQTTTQPSPELSTEHQKEGDARSPSDTLDRGQEGTPGGQPVEDVADRTNVSTVKPEDYPQDRPDR
ncbi:hypothetical protein ASG11_06835 [Sphingomonas sp. Leaf357]|uniref:hypothetical protein n=1 Tax=Sphingomonas sp. Leaf357 TaxID=1736350 RepID=UPI0006FBACBC|nr:hypothetical protein [Sphingomonas sp. Leaf357]KQS04001.1 hypothetical protein ASG11_06835 [Sphingomonas sp. Leaf357]